MICQVFLRHVGAVSWPEFRDLQVHPPRRRQGAPCLEAADRDTKGLPSKGGGYISGFPARRTTVVAAPWQPAVWKGRRQDELEEVALESHIASPLPWSSPRCLDFSVGVLGRLSVSLNRPPGWR